MICSENRAIYWTNNQIAHATMSNEANLALQYDMFTNELVDTRSRAQKTRDAANALPKQTEMFPQRELAQFGVTAKPQLPLSPKTRLELSIVDARSEQQKDQDKMNAAEANTYSLFNHDPPSSPEPRIVKVFPSRLSFDMIQVEEPDPQFALKLTDEIDILLESARDAAYERARGISHLAGNEIYLTGDNQLEVWKPDRSGFFLVTYSDIEMVENIEWVAQDAEHNDRFIENAQRKIHD